MSQSRLTTAFLNTVKTPGKYYDGNGLFVQVYPTGARCWQQRITIAGRRRTLGLGGYPVVTLKMARDLALENLRTVRMGDDPLALKRRRKAPTFRQAAAIVLEHYRPTWTEVHKAERWMSSLETYAMPILGDLPVSSIAPRDVLAVVLPIWTKKPETAKKVRQRISAVMRWAVAEGFAPVDPAGDAIAGALPRHNKPRQHFPAVPHQQVSAVLAKIHASTAPTALKLMLEFLVLTAVRSGEARGARWSEFDSDTATWTVPAERMKSRTQHRVPLSSRALSVLRLARQLCGTGELVFPASNGARFPQRRPVVAASPSRCRRCRSRISILVP